MNNIDLSKILDPSNRSANERKQDIKRQLDDLEKRHAQERAVLMERSRIITNLAKEYDFSDSVLSQLTLHSAYADASLRIKVNNILEALTLLKTLEPHLLEIMKYKGTSTSFQPLINEYSDKSNRSIERATKKEACGNYIYHVKGYRSSRVGDEHEIQFFIKAGENDIIDCDIIITEGWRELYRQTEWKHHSTKYSTNPTRVETNLFQRSRTWFNNRLTWGACSDQPNTFTLSLPTFDPIETFIDQVKAVELSGVGVGGESEVAV